MPQEQHIFPRRDHGADLGFGDLMVLVRIMDTGFLAIASVSKSGGLPLPAKPGVGLTAFQPLHQIPQMRRTAIAIKEGLLLLG